MKETKPEKDNRIFTAIGITILILYLIAAVIYLLNLQTQVKIQNARQLNLIGIKKIYWLERSLKGFVLDSGGMVTALDISYDGSLVTVDLAEEWDLLKESYKERLIKKYGSTLISLYRQAGFYGVRQVKFYDCFGPVSEDYQP